MNAPYYPPPPPAPRNNASIWILGILGAFGGCALIFVIAIAFAVSTFQRSSAFHSARARSMQNQRNFAEAEKEWRIAYEVKKDDPSVLNNFAWCLYLEGKNAEAESLAQTAVKLNPGRLNYMDTLAHIHFGLQKYDLAEKEFKQVVKTEPTHGYSYQGLGHIYEHKKDYAQAQGCYIKAPDRARPVEGLEEDLKRIEKLVAKDKAEGRRQ